MSEVVRLVSVDDAGAGDPGAPGPNMVAITYSTPDVPPRTVFVNKSKDTPEERQRVIGEDLEAVRAARPTFLDLP